MTEMIECIEREIKMREWVYPGRVAAKKMSQKKADTEMAMMRAVLLTLEELRATSAEFDDELPL